VYKRNFEVAVHCGGLYEIGISSGTIEIERWIEENDRSRFHCTQNTFGLLLEQLIVAHPSWLPLRNGSPEVLS
jgi:hypothetical protein